MDGGIGGAYLSCLTEPRNKSPSSGCPHPLPAVCVPSAENIGYTSKLAVIREAAQAVPNAKISHNAPFPEHRRGSPGGKPHPRHTRSEGDAGCRLGRIVRSRDEIPQSGRSPQLFPIPGGFPISSHQRGDSKFEITICD